MHDVIKPLSTQFCHVLKSPYTLGLKAGRGKKKNACTLTNEHTRTYVHTHTNTRTHTPDR
ncbi:hypothetical protein T492DRAFT_1048690 [Pavlovales sp. CCMP2436]|nr:hypothetical protein T492DRAFT_1048690 [Pavlovales sp. CCMP2436]